MAIYFSVFSVAFIFAYFAEKKYNNNKKGTYILLSLMAITIPSVMAGMRASGVGTDTKVYIDWAFASNVRATNITDAINFINNSGLEPLYCLVNYIVSRFTNNLSVMYFVLEFIFLAFSYGACVRISKKINLSFSFAYYIYMILFFNKSLNLCRQSIAMSICLFSLSNILSREWKQFTILMVIAFCFHKATVLFMPLYFIYEISITNKKINFVLASSIVVIILLGVIFYAPIIELLVNIGILSEKYLNYIYVYGGNSNIKFIEIFAQFIILVISLVLRKYLNKNSRYNNFFVWISVLAFVSFLFGVNAKYVQRISYFYSYCLIFIIAQVPKIFTYKRDKFFSKIIILIILFIYSYAYYDMYRFDQTIPYVIGI